VGGHGSSRGGPRRRGHAEQRLTGGGSLGRGTPVAFGLGENAQGMEGDEVDAMALIAGFTVARGGGTAVAAELRSKLAVACNGGGGATLVRRTRGRERRWREAAAWPGRRSWGRLLA
jgi:hypothetical protein